LRPVVRIGIAHVRDGVELEMAVTLGEVFTMLVGQSGDLFILDVGVHRPEGLNMFALALVLDLDGVHDGRTACLAKRESEAGRDGGGRDEERRRLGTGETRDCNHGNGIRERGLYY